MHSNMAVYWIFLLSWIYVGFATSEQVKFTHLPRAYASPVNVDPKLDCAIKELAWEYAKKLLPQVN